MAGHQELDPRLAEQVPLRADAAAPDDHPDRRRGLGGFVMTITADALTKQDEEQRGALVERLFRGGIAVLEMLSIYVGDRLGLYRALAQDGPSTAAHLARS